MVSLRLYNWMEKDFDGRKENWLIAKELGDGFDTH